MRDETSSTGFSRREYVGSVGALGLLGFAGCTQSQDGDGDGNGGLSGDITITGSSTVFPLATAVRSAFREQHPDVSIDISPTGSGGGFSQHFCRGNSDINNASRPITDSEESLCAENGVDFHEIKVATDALSVIVNNDASWVDCLSVDELARIWGPDAADTWQDVRDDWPDESLNRFGPTSASGTFDYFTEEVIGEEGSHTQNYSATEQDNQILTGVEGSEYAIGYLGYAYYSQNPDRVTAVPIETESGDCVGPTLESAKTGSYRLARPLFTYPSMSALGEEHIAEFCRFFVEQSASESLVADQVGYVPNSQSEMETELSELNDAIDSVQ